MTGNLMAKHKGFKMTEVIKRYNLYTYQHKVYNYKDLLNHILEKDITKVNDCIEKLTDRKKYNQIIIDGKCWVTHKFIYYLYHGFILTDSHIHHTCRNKICVNPKHLQLVDLSTHKKLHSETLTKHWLKEYKQDGILEG